jgi:hypothetical protein
MNIELMALNAVITTFALIFIAEVAGKKYARYSKKLLGFLAVWPILFIPLKLLWTSTGEPDKAIAEAPSALGQMIGMLPAYIISGYIGVAVGFVLWGIYRGMKRIKRWL